MFLRWVFLISSRGREERFKLFVGCDVVVDDNKKDFDGRSSCSSYMSWDPFNSVDIVDIAIISGVKAVYKMSVLLIYAFHTLYNTLYTVVPFAIGLVSSSHTKRRRILNEAPQPLTSNQRQLSQLASLSLPTKPSVQIKTPTINPVCTPGITYIFYWAFVKI